MSKRERSWRVFIALVGIFFVGTGIAFNANAMLGNDSIGIVYDGVRNIANLSATQLGIATNIVNFTLAIFVFFMGRKYINVGTLIYILPYGLIVDLGGKIYRTLIQVNTLPCRVFGAVMGCLLVYIGVALFIAADIGLDPFTGVVMIIKDKVHKEFRTVKVTFDISTTVLGFLLGGELGAITVVAAVIGGPSIQWFAEKFKRILVKEKKSS